MKNSYSISYLFVISALSIMLVCAYSYNHNAYEEKYLGEIEYVDGSNINNTGAEIRDGFILRANGDYVVVYLYDDKTIFEETEILMCDLSDSLQKEITKGKHIKTTLELYGFLENFSS